MDLRTLVVLLALTFPACTGQPRSHQAQRIAQVEHGLTTPVVIEGQPPVEMTLQGRI